MRETLPSLDALVYQALVKHSSKDHLLSMTDLRSYCDLNGHPADRRTIYKTIKSLCNAGVEIVFIRKKGEQGYYLKHLFTNSEALFLMNAVEESSVLSEAETEHLIQKIDHLMPERSISQIPPLSPNPIKQKEHSLLDVIEKLFPAIAEHRYVEFLYFDITVTKKKHYRKEKQKYRLVPYAIVSSNNRYYIVFYSDSHHSFANYRLDKMDQVAVSEDHGEGIPFNLADHMRTSFQMYHGAAQTVTAEFDLSLSSIVFDQFGDDIVISKVGEKTFTASLRTTLTPTLTAWFLQFNDRVLIKKPKALIEQYQNIASSLLKQYPIDS